MVYQLTKVSGKVLAILSSSILDESQSSLVIWYTIGNLLFSLILVHDCYLISRKYFMNKSKEDIPHDLKNYQWYTRLPKLWKDPGNSKVP